MKRAATILIFLLSVATSAMAQDTPIPDLQQLNSAIKNPYITVEQLDKIQHDLKYFDSHPLQNNEQKAQVFDLYRTLANGYSANNHFKQGYSVYQTYLGLKEKSLSMEKEQAISGVMKELESKQSKDENELIDRKNEIQQLNMDNASIEAKRKSFKRYFSFGVIALTLWFSFLLLQAGIKWNKIRHDLKTGRERLKSIHRVSSMGRLKKGMTFIFQNNLSSIKKMAETNLSIADQWQPAANKKNEELTGLKKALTDLIKKLS